MTDKLLTPQDIADRLQLQLRTVYGYLAPGGALHHLRIEIGPKIVRVKESAFNAHLDKAGAVKQ